MRSHPLQHDAYLASLAALPPVDLLTVTDAGAVAPLARVALDALLPRLRVSQTDVRADVDHIAPEILHWSRVAALQKRVWMVREREYRVWKAEKELAFRAAKDQEAVAAAAEAAVAEAAAEAEGIPEPRVRKKGAKAESTVRAGWGQGGKVSSEQVEAVYRTDPEYAVVSRALEAAEEAYLFADGVLQAYKAKREVLLADLRRMPDGSLQRMS